MGGVSQTLTAQPLRMIGCIWGFGLALMVGLLLLSRANMGGRAIIKISGTDSLAYYAMTHSLLFDHDFDLSNQYAALKPPDWQFNQIQKTGLPGNPFPLGFSLLEVPFLEAGHLAGRMVDGRDDGYSRACMTAYYAGIIFYLCVGLTFLFLWLRSVGLSLGVAAGSSEWVALLVTLALWPSTTVGYYSFAPMSHIAAFMACSLFLWAWWRAKDTASLRRWLLVGVTGGLFALCRWQAVLFVVVPLLYELIERRRNAGAERIPLRLWFRALLAGAIGYFLLLVPQIVAWKRIYGAYLTVPQGDGFMHFPPPYAMRVLFSSQHGWFVWTPITLIGIAGLISQWRRLQLVVPLLVAVALQVALIGSLASSWHGHQNFGLRMLTSCTPIVGMGLAFWLWFARPSGRVVVVLLSTLCSAYTVLFAVQYRLDLVAKNSRLTVQELLGDKLHLRSAMARHAAVQRAEQQLDQGDAATTIATLLETRRKFGADRQLLSLLVVAYLRAGDVAQRDAAEQSLKELLDSTVY